MRTRLSPATAIIVAILVAACQSAALPTTPTPDGGATPTQPGAGGAPTDGVGPTGDLAPTGAPTNRPADLPPTSEELIGAALAAGAVSYEESLLYRAQALFNSPGLPEAYRSPVTDMDAGTALLAEVDAHEAELSDAVIAQLAPYRVRPSDPTSIFSAVTPPIASLAGYPMTAGLPAWLNAPAAAGAARVWVEDTPGAQRRLDQHAQDVTRVWYAMQGVFTYPDPDEKNIPSAAINPDSAVDFYWVELSDVDPRRAECSADPSIEHCVFASYEAAGFARAAPPTRVNASSAYFVMAAGGGSDDALFTVAHELAHGSQFHYDNADATWLHEASANWVAYRVFQKLDLPPEPAYKRLTRLFDRLDMPITSADDRGYRAWLYFQFAAMEEGDGVVTRIWEAAGRQGEQGAEAVETAFPFAKHFADFALRNWNQEPVPRRYRNAPDLTFPTLTPWMTVYEQALVPNVAASLETALPQLASAYYSYTVDPAVRKVTFDNALMSVPGAHVWAIVSIGKAGSGSSVVEDWAGVSKRVFCIPREDVTKIVLVVSNAQVARGSNLSGKIAIDPVAQGCGAGGLVTFKRITEKSVVTPTQCGGGATVDETRTVTISVAFDGQNKGTATVSEQGHSVEVSTSIDCPTGKRWVVTTTRDEHVVGTKDIFLFWWTSAGVLDFNAVWEQVTGGTSLFEIRCVPTLPACDQTTTGDLASAYISVAFKADVDEKAAVMSGSKVEDLSSEGESDIITYTWTIEK